MKRKPKVERGHWPKGKRRNPDSGQWSRTLLRLQKLLDNHWKRGVISQTALAQHLDVSPHTVRRWLDRVDRPCVEHQTAVKAWIEAMS